jgi:uncharacterized protein YaiI (UPF0178 family)
MRLSSQSIRSGLQHIANEAPNAVPDHRGQRWREDALDAMAYIRQLEGDLRRAGFTEYTDPRDKETHE